MNTAIHEEVLVYGENNRGFGILGLSEVEDAPVVVLFNAGLLHRSEPFRLNTELARLLSVSGFNSVRFDLSGKGDTPVRQGLSNRESVAADWAALKSAVAKRLGKKEYLLMGLCSGADNAVKIAAVDEDIKGLILFDPIPPRHPKAKLGLIRKKLINPWFWLRMPKVIVSLFLDTFTSRFAKRYPNEDSSSSPKYGLRDIPKESELAKALTRVLDDGVGAFCLFTSYSFESYGVDNQLAEGLSLSEEQRTKLMEVYRPDFDHLISLQEHRQDLFSMLLSWLGRS